ncbi:MAG: twin-arginine translocase subunit TatC [Deltaproteobacteria bacterium]|nr:twin-arginine translocase subunit TatC [Deltaproteobacteria bacterium]
MTTNPAALPGEAVEAEMGLFDHLAELRRRLIFIFIAVIVSAIFAYTISAPVLSLLFEPFNQTFEKGSLIGTGPAEAFILKIKVALFVGLLFAAPVVFLQIWLFIAPGLYEHERRLVVPFVLVTSLLFFVGVWFCFYVVFPFAFEFFRDQYLSIEDVKPAIKVDEYLSLVIRGLLGFGIVFEMPVLAYFLARVGVIDHRMLISGTRYAIVFIFILSAILTPPDVLTQFLMAFPLLLLYGLSILIVKYAERPTVDDQ